MSEEAALDTGRSPRASSGAPPPPPVRPSPSYNRASTTGHAQSAKPAKAFNPAVAASRKDGDLTSVVTQSDAGSDLLKAERPDERVVTEIVGCLKMKTSMLAMGACERVKKIARAYPVEVSATAIMDELVAILKDSAASQLSGAVMQALSIMALNPEGRQRLCMAGVAAPLIVFIRTADLTRPNMDRAVTLLMNLGADSSNRRLIRESGGVEALVQVLKVAPVNEPIGEHALGALHNLALLDTKVKNRALDAGVLQPLVRIVTTKGLPDTDMCVVRARMILTELLKLPDTEDMLALVAAEMGVKL